MKGNKRDLQELKDLPFYDLFALIFYIIVKKNFYNFHRNHVSSPTGLFNTFFIPSINAHQKELLRVL